MKRLFLLLYIVMTLFVNGQTNVYHPFPDSNASWNFHYNLFCFPIGTADEYYSITISGDTIINGLTYHKLTTPYVESFSTGTCVGISTGYKGAIRQDTGAKMIFIVPPSSSTEQLLYDFTMQVGDTVRGYIEANTFTKDVVQSIDSVLVGSSYRKRWYINNCYGIYYIEGIGSTYGLIERSPGCITDDADYSLTCFRQNGQTLYSDTVSDCQLITTINSPDKIFKEVNILPNPSNGTFVINCGNADLKEIIISDMLGKVVMHHQTDKRTEFKIYNLNSGTYLLTAIENSGRRVNKKIVSCP